MNPFRQSASALGRSHAVRFVKRPAVFVTALCLIVGMLAVAWRARVRVSALQAAARADALAVSAGVEAQFNQAITAVEVLQTLARQGNLSLPNLGQIAGELLRSRPTVAAVELLPAGVVRDAIPRSGNERAIGYNILKDPMHRLAVNTAMATRSLVVAGPVRLWDDSPGFRALAPLFQRARDGREVFWGFVAASMRSSDVFARARLPELARRGYSFAVLADAPVPQSPIRLAQAGGLNLSRALQQPVRLRNVELTLALAPSGGWLSAIGLIIRGLGILVIAALACACVVFLEQGQALRSALEAATLQRSQDAGQLRQAQEQLQDAAERAGLAEAELRRARSAADQAESKAAEARAQLTQAEHAARQALESLGERLQHADARTRQLQSDLEKAASSAADLRSARAEVQTLKEQIRELKAQKNSAESQVGELSARLDETRSELARQAEAAAHAAAAEARAFAAQPEPVPEAGAPGKSERELPGETPPETSLASALTLHEPARAPKVVAVEAVPATTPDPTEEVTPAESPGVLDAADVAKAAADALPSEEPSARRPRSERPKRSAPQHQMDLFTSEPVGAEAAAAAVEVASAEPKQENAPAAEPHADSTRSNEMASDSAANPAAERVTDARHHRAAPVAAARLLSLEDVAQFREAVSQIVPLLADQDPGARDCFKDNKATFRAAFSPEGFEHFQESVRSGKFAEGLELLRKAARKQGVSA